MKTENKDKKDLFEVLEMLDKSWDQILSRLPDDPEEATVGEIRSSTIAMSIIDKIKEQIQHYLITGEKKDIQILFDKEGSIYL